MKEILDNIIKWLSNLIKERQFASAERLAKKEAEPVPFIQYERVLFWFLYHHSNKYTGIQFKDRLTQELIKNKEYGFDPYAFNLDFVVSRGLVTEELLIFNMRNSLARVFKVKKTNYACQGKYKLNANEMNSIADLEELKEAFNVFAVQSFGLDPNKIILLHSIVKEQSYLIFNLYQYGKFKEYHKNTTEISLEDGDF
ncbi:hypothetical protein [Oceanobacillus sp. J11TS1]|uniref:hypothetical protein n=1 Tax=Oceanobacillus sp. J11TS1 TaxID=2807191 RepID=UPI001B22DCCE|nr:hypothetical protein [Oceanobacillus sp. J11TS1]GIO22513.1 hypothetical protein J11TS1_10940 [Oceanobacillus sp. J11TS1]